jgi:hypothetical protein
MAVVANNTFHLWLTMPFNGAMIIPPESLTHVPPGVRDILNLVGNVTSAIYVREPPPGGQDRIDILLDNLRSSTIDTPSLIFQDILDSWFSDLLLGGNQATEDTGVDNQIFRA